MTILQRNSIPPISIPVRLTIIFAVLASAVACGSSGAPTASRSPTPGANSNSLFTFVSKKEIRAVNGARFEPVIGADGRENGIRIIARDNNDGGTLPKCVCETSACAGSCKLSGSGVSASCDGSCSNSEGNACGGCTFETPVPPGGTAGTTAIDVTNKPPVVKEP
jgi:hypothetical protein